MPNNTHRRLYLLICLLLAFTTAQAQERSPAAPVPESMSLYAVDTKDGKRLLTFDEANKLLVLYAFRGGKLEQLTSCAAPGRVWRAASYSHGTAAYLAVAVGYGRDTIGAPVQVILYESDLRNSRIVFEQASPRSQITDLRQINNSLAITFFDSKYYTRTGMLAPESAGNWKFTELFRTRLGMSIDYNRAIWLVGRMYPDPEQRTGEVLLYNDGKLSAELPSVRGASSAVFLRSSGLANPPILIGDGWDQDYAKKAEPRLSLLEYDTHQKKYSETLISTTPPQISITKIVQIGDYPSGAILAAGDRFIDLYYPSRKWQRTRVYEKTAVNELINLDFAVIDRSDETAMLAVYDGTLKTVKITITGSSQ